MDGLTILIDWPYALGILGALLLVTWHAGSKFSRVETSIEWLKETVNELKTAIDNRDVKAFATESPVRLTPRGKELLRQSGLKDYIDSHKEEILQKCETKRSTNPYEVQEHIFELFDKLEFEAALDNQLKEFSFQQGLGMNIMRRIGAIYFRDFCLENFGMKVEDIDKNKTHAATQRS